MFLYSLYILLLNLGPNSVNLEAVAKAFCNILATWSSYLEIFLKWYQLVPHVNIMELLITVMRLLCVT